MNTLALFEEQLITQLRQSHTQPASAENTALENAEKNYAGKIGNIAIDTDATAAREAFLSCGRVLVAYGEAGITPKREIIDNLDKLHKNHPGVSKVAPTPTAPATPEQTTPASKSLIDEEKIIDGAADQAAKLFEQFAKDMKRSGMDIGSLISPDMVREAARKNAERGRDFLNLLKNDKPNP